MIVIVMMKVSNDGAGVRGMDTRNRHRDAAVKLGMEQQDKTSITTFISITQ
jgi:hypothetical protein